MSNPKKLTEKQKCFCEEYLIDLNATQAAIRAGYKSKTAEVQGPRLLGNVRVKEYLSELMSRKQKGRIASADEVLSYLTRVISGESESEVLVTRSMGKDLGTEIVHEMKKPDEKDKLKAAELLARYHGLMAPQQVEVKNEVTVNIDQFNSLLVTTKGMTRDEKEEYKRRLKGILEDHDG